MDRRNFFKFVGIAGATIASTKANASSEPSKKEFNGTLVDTTRCIGCRSCEKACAKEHGLKIPDILNDNGLETIRDTSENQLTVVNQFKNEESEVFVKKQCMHCWQPACAAACLTNALHKTEEGPVVWRSNKCMGCRYCMVSCPFNIPKFEYNEWNPKIQKCDNCWERLKAGKKPACVEACPTEALMHGRKKELMEIARVRIYNHPNKYIHKIYGENDVGGTGWLYISSQPFEKIGFKKELGTEPYPIYTRDFLYNVPLVFFGFPAIMFGLHLLTDKADDKKE